jgi:LysR family hydrogen peroxide-inducible transcriptional activator
VIGTTARWLVPLLLEKLAERHPAVKIVILDATTSSLVPQLLGGQIDLAIVNLPVDDPDLTIETLFDEERLLVAPAGHPLYDRQSVTLADLAEHELLLEATGTSFRNELDAHAAAQGIELKAQAEVDGMRLLASLAFSGFGAAILPASAAPGWVGGDWRRVPIVGLQGRAVGLARRRRGLPSAAERAVAEVIGIVVRDGAVDQPGLHLATPPGGPVPA